MFLYNYLRIISFSRSPLSRIPSCYFSCFKKNRTQNFEYENNIPNYTQQKLLSFNSVVDTTMQSQSGIFKTLSESTPVEYCQNLLIGIHNTTGLPWWGTIICTTILLRSVVTVPLAAYQMYVLAKLELIKMEMPEIVQELKRETAVAIKLYNLDEKTARVMYNRSIRKQWNNLIVRENCHPFKTVLLVIFQIPMWISVSISLRNLMYMLPNQDLGAKLIFTELSTQGVAWIPNLIAADTSFILPLAFGLTNLVIIELQSLSKVTVPTKLQRYMTHVFRGLTICLIPIAASVPSGLVLYWTTSSVFGLVQNLLLMSPKVKRMCRIPLTPSELENPYKQVYLGLQYRLKIKSRVKNET